MILGLRLSLKYVRFQIKTGRLITLVHILYNDCYLLGHVFLKYWEKIRFTRKEVIKEYCVKKVKIFVEMM